MAVIYIYMYVCVCVYFGSKSALRQHSLDARWDSVSISFIFFFFMSRNNFRKLPLISFVTYAF